MYFPIVVLTLLTVVKATFYEDAFVKDWVRHNYGQISQFDMLSKTSLVGKTEGDEMIGMELGDDNDLKWKITLPEDCGSQFEVFGSFIYTFGGDKSGYIWHSESGVPKAKLTVDGIKSVYNFFNKGVLALVGNDLYHCGTDGGCKSLVSGVGSDIKVSNYGQYSYVLTNNYKLIKVRANLEVSEHSVNFKLGKVSQFVDNVVVMGGSVYDLDQAKVINSGNNLQIINSKLSYSYNDHSLKIFNLDQPVFDQGFVSFDTIKLVDHCFVLSNDNESLVMNIADFMDDLELSLIKYSSFPLTIDNSEVYLFSDAVVSVSLNDTTMSFITLNMDNEDIITKTYNLDHYLLTFPNSLLVNKPESEKTMESIQHLIDEIVNNNFFTRWHKRTIRHLKEFGRFVVGKFVTLNPLVDSYTINDPFGFEKLMVYVDTNNLIAIDSLNGKVEWKTLIDEGLTDLLEFQNNLILVYSKKLVRLSSRDGNIIDTIDLDQKIDGVYKLIGSNNEEILVAKSKSTVTPLFESELIDQHFIEKGNGFIQGYEISNNQLQPTWKFTHDYLEAIASKPKHSKSSAIGTSLHDKSVLYSYQNDNSLSVIVNENGVIKVYLLDGITGNMLYYHEHVQEAIDSKSIKLLMDDNWIIYSYLVVSPVIEQRIIVTDLFGNKPNAKPVSNFDTNTTSVVKHYTKSYIFPEVIIDMKPTQTVAGVTVKSIIILTENGDLIEIPKYILNSRRVDDHVLTAQDAKDDFRMTPYEPVIQRNNFQVLNHEHKLEVDHEHDFILIKPTKLESTSIVCFINSNNQFCTRVQPSLTFDVLRETFDKYKLMLTIVIIVGGYLITSPMVLRKNLNNAWVYK